MMKRKMLLRRALMVGVAASMATAEENAKSTTLLRRRPLRNEHPKLHRALEEDAVLVGDYLVQVHPDHVIAGSLTDFAQDLVAAYPDVTIARYYPQALFAFELLNVPGDLLTQLLDCRAVISVEENQVVEALQVVNTQVTQLPPIGGDIAQANTMNGYWGLDFTSWPMDGIYQWGEWDGTGVDVYVLDTGLSVHHVEFAPGRAHCAHSVFTDNNGVNSGGNGGEEENILIDIVNVEDGSNDAIVVNEDVCRDDHSHGTHIAGIIGGTLSGVAKGVSLHAVKVLGHNGKGSMATVAAGVEWVIDHVQPQHQKVVINLSIGGGQSPLLNLAIQRAFEAGIVVVGAAGNNAGQDACNFSPASAQQALIVGALAFDGRPAPFSNQGACVNVWAPGDDIFGPGAASVSQFLPKSGTSQACGFVSGLAALYLQSGILSNAQVVDHIVGHARVNSEDGLLLAYSGLIGGVFNPEQPIEDPASDTIDGPVHDAVDDSAVHDTVGVADAAVTEPPSTLEPTVGPTTTFLPSDSPSGTPTPLFRRIRR